ncbi:hypothetical protein GQA08_23250, partial [Escherichia coli]|nr:hypothetical protein [Escherichia coli]
MLPSETMIWQPEFTDKTLSRKPGAVQLVVDGKAVVASLKNKAMTFNEFWEEADVTVIDDAYRRAARIF